MSEFVILYRGHKTALKPNESIKSPAVRNGYSYNLDTYIPIREGAATPYPKSLRSLRSKAAYDHRSGGRRFRGCPLGHNEHTKKGSTKLNVDPAFHGSPFIALTVSSNYARYFGDYIYQVTIPVTEWEKYGISDVVQYLRGHGVKDPIEGINGNIPTHIPETVFGNIIPPEWVELSHVTPKL